MPTIDKVKALADIDDVIAYANDALPRKGDRATATAMMLACIDRWAPPGSPYRRPYYHAQHMAYDIAEAQQAIGNVTALRRDIAADMLTNFVSLVNAAVFADYLTQAEHLHGGGYLLAAAVLAGVTMEEHLRKLAANHSVSTTNAKGAAEKAAVVNDQLAKASAYSAADRDQIHAWLKIRNEAAHNDPDFVKRQPDEIGRMIEGVRSLLARHPA